MSFVLIGLAAASGAFHFPHVSPPHLPKLSTPSLRRSDTRVNKKKIAGWTLYTYKDSFTGITTCRLYGRKIVYESGNLLFQFSPTTDTSRATYRVAAGPVLTAVAPLQNFLTTNLAHLENPSRGRVSLPAAELANAMDVAIRPRYAQKASTFKLEGFDRAMAAATEQGCPR